MQTATDSQVTCQDIGWLPGGEEYNCDIIGSDGSNQGDSQWLDSDGQVSRVSSGGDNGSPPANAQVAATVVEKASADASAVTSVSCVPITHDSIGIAIQDAYDCTIYGDGTSIETVWRWNSNGTVREEQLAGSGNASNTGSSDANSGNPSTTATGSSTTQSYASNADLESDPACGKVAGLGGFIFYADFTRAIDCSKAISVLRVYVAHEATLLSKGDYPGRVTFGGWNCFVSLNPPPQWDCGGNTGQQISGVFARSRTAQSRSTSSLSALVKTLDAAFTADPPKTCGNAGICSPFCNLANGTTVLNEVTMGLACSALADLLNTNPVLGQWRVTNVSVSGDADECNLMGTKALSRIDNLSVFGVSGNDASNLCQALTMTGDWTGQAS